MSAEQVKEFKFVDHIVESREDIQQYLPQEEDEN